MRCGLPIVFTGVAALAVWACEQPVAACAPEVSLVGEWSYLAAPSTSHPFEVQGTLAITGESCQGFDGRVDLIEAGVLGTVQGRVGAVHGRLVGSGSLRFDAIFETGVRQHIAELRGDSIIGSFVDDHATPAGLASGDFTGVRKEAP